MASEGMFGRDDMFKWLEHKRHRESAEPITRVSTSPPETESPDCETPIPLGEYGNQHHDAQTPKAVADTPIILDEELDVPNDDPEPAETLDPLNEANTSSPAQLPNGAGQLENDAAPAPQSNPQELEPSPDVDEMLLPLNEQQRVIEALTKVRREPKPVPGMAAVELAPPRFRTAYVISVKAGGRRITARIQDVDRIYSYTLRADSTYRLEGVPTKSAPRLILDVDV